MRESIYWWLYFLYMTVFISFMLLAKIEKQKDILMYIWYSIFL